MVLEISIWLSDEDLTGTITQDKSGPGINRRLGNTDKIQIKDLNWKADKYIYPSIGISIHSYFFVSFYHTHTRAVKHVHKHIGACTSIFSGNLFTVV